jgi:sigma-70-like protein
MLPEREREALSLAYFEELTHEQVAAALHIPLGTTKTRIRLAIRRLAPVIAAAICVAVLVLAWRRAERDAALESRALTVVTSSDVVPLRLEAVPGVPSETHANYRIRPGGALAVLFAERGRVQAGTGVRSVAATTVALSMAQTPSVPTVTLKCSSGSMAGPWMACPVGENIEPWHPHEMPEALNEP